MTSNLPPSAVDVCIGRHQHAVGSASHVRVPRPVLAAVFAHLRARFDREISERPHADFTPTVGQFGDDLVDAKLLRPEVLAHDEDLHRALLEVAPDHSLHGDGTTLAVGAWRESSSATGIDGPQGDNSKPSSGAVYVFIRNGSAWSQQAYIKASNADANDFFGRDVALSADGNTLAAVARGEDGSATGIDGDQMSNAMSASGAVYVFTRSHDIWVQQAYVKASNPDINDSFGTDVALSADGSTLAVGTTGEDGSATGIDGDQTSNSMSQSGAVYVFARSGSDWLQEAYLKASNTEAGDSFGSSVVLSGDGATLAVGAPNEDSGSTGVGSVQTDNSKPQAGAVYVFRRSSSAWSQQAYVKAAIIGGLQSFFGSDVALNADGTTLAVGTSEDSGPDFLDVSMRGAGSVSVFTRSDSAWSQQAYVRGSNTDGVDYFGHSVALSADGNILAVGAWGKYSGEPTSRLTDPENAPKWTGAAYTFVRSGSTWSERSHIKASNAEPFDWFGIDVALSGDGSILAAGADHEASNATGVGGTQADESMDGAGALYLY